MKVEDVQKIAVVGLGKMGSDWVAQFLGSGFEVIGFDEKTENYDIVKKSVRDAVKWIFRKDENAEAKVDKALGNLTLTASWDEFYSHADHVQILLECVFEDYNLKCELLKVMAPRFPDTTMFWSNTSSLNVEGMGDACGSPERFVGTHGMNPVYMMPAVEVITHDKIATESLTFTLDLLSRIGKIPFTAANVAGFWVNKHLIPFMLEAYRALERGEITVKDGDSGLKHSLGHPQGVFLLSDFIGTDTMYRVAMSMYLATQDPRYYPPVLLTRMFKEGLLGLKSGKGFYHWDKGKPGETVDYSDWALKDSSVIPKL